MNHVVKMTLNIDVKNCSITGLNFLRMTQMDT